MGMPLHHGLAVGTAGGGDIITDEIGRPHYAAAACRLTNHLPLALRFQPNLRSLAS
jgi:hypothetical protein